MVHSCPLFNIVMPSLLLSTPSSLPCRIIFAKPEDLQTWQYHFNFRVFLPWSGVHHILQWLLGSSSLVTWSLYEMFNSLWQHHISMACILSLNSTVKAHDSQVESNMKMTSERISVTFDLGDMLLSVQLGFSFVGAAVACAILYRLSCFVLSSETTAPRYLKLVTVPSFCPFILIPLWMPFVL